MLEACQARDGRPASLTLTWVPAAFLEAQKVSAWGDLPAWIPASSEEAGLARVVITRALAAGLAFRPLAETARDTLAWWKGLPAERRQKPRAGLSAEREVEVLASWKASQR
jgi:2'-hydroxyisoflavone reductase